ncbi:hypothetical protein [Roseospira visakhapatnamensis]|uniref:Glycine zipper domain-containing protein n=1 Tax=Roseospira visakhapatnamensis TaxID=390880 RepID=A0A7W6RCN3_9PROT|nr:hypothetical protein [Roseospira visakhapatnamensis]MBB4265917.1 hypothetical protein [Roseospira visakhapatnamensis]
MTARTTIALAIAAPLALGACSNMTKQQQSTLSGGAIGAGAGAAGAAILGGPVGAAAAVGGAAGAAAGFIKEEMRE